LLNQAEHLTAAHIGCTARRIIRLCPVRLIEFLQWTYGDTDNGASLELLLPFGITENTVEMTVAMYYLLVCYYRFLHDPEFVQEQMDWLEANAKHGLDFGEYQTAPTVTAH
jgi:hypothetical protein